ncbi:hypothetical protein [Pontibacter kalidii]|uniref:hypothetical protein n=1 Tax=Pontibacter kalidii TaxID=2592049 RepID=UPI00225BE97F|nr:hypothetical protein [Pontibacter kalidii]
MKAKYKDEVIQKYVKLIGDIQDATDCMSGATSQQLKAICEKHGVSRLSFQHIVDHNLDVREVGKKKVYVWSAFNRNLTYRNIAERSIDAQRTATRKSRAAKKQALQLLEASKQPVTVPMVVSQPEPVSLPSYSEMIESLRGRVAEKRAEQQQELESCAHYEAIMRQTRARAEAAGQEIERLEDIIGKLEEIAAIQGKEEYRLAA